MVPPIEVGNDGGGKSAWWLLPLPYLNLGFAFEHGVADGVDVALAADAHLAGAASFLLPLLAPGGALRIVSTGHDA